MLARGPVSVRSVHVQARRPHRGRLRLFCPRDKAGRLCHCGGGFRLVIAGGSEITNAQYESKAPGEPRKMTNDERVRKLWCHYDQSWDIPQLSIQDLGLSQWIIAYAKRYGLDLETLYDVLDARIYANYHNGQHNPKAVWNTPLDAAARQAGFASPREYLRSPEKNPFLFWPIRLFDGARRADGAGAVVLCAADISSRFTSKPVRILGTGNALSTTVSDKAYSQPFIVEAGRQATEMAGVAARQLDIAELYDYVAPEYIIPLEDMGYIERGECWRAILDKRTTFEGDRPVNLSGGSSAGSVTGCVGAIQSYYMVRQLRGEAGANQVKPIPEKGLIFDCGATRDAVVLIYGRE